MIDHYSKMPLHKKNFKKFIATVLIFFSITELVKIKSAESKRKAKAGTRDNKQELKGGFTLRSSAESCIS